MTTSTCPWIAAAAALCIELGASAGAQAEERNVDRRAPVQVTHLDSRFNHNRSYPSAGRMIPALPSGAVSTHYRGSPYYFHNGAWYRPMGGRYVVVGAPLGLLVPFLPPFYTNDAYYLWNESQQGYVITSPPQDPATASTTPPDTDQLYIYPKSGQAEEQQSRDRYDCHLEARQQSGFDPTQPAGGVDPSQSGAKRMQYRQVQKACLEARGYSVS
jgi:hypothetical protein